MSYQHGQNGMVIRTDPSGDVWHIPPDPGNADYQRFLADVEAGAKISPADPLPEPEPTQSQQVDQLVAASKGAISQAASLADVKVAFGAAMDGLGAIYGTGDKS